MQESLDSDSLAIFRVDNGGQFAVLWRRAHGSTSAAPLRTRLGLR